MGNLSNKQNDNVKENIIQPNVVVNQTKEQACIAIPTPILTEEITMSNITETNNTADCNKSLGRLSASPKTEIDPNIIDIETTYIDENKQEIKSVNIMFGGADNSETIDIGEFTNETLTEDIDIDKIIDSEIDGEVVKSEVIKKEDTLKTSDIPITAKKEEEDDSDEEDDNEEDDDEKDENKNEETADKTVSESDVDEDDDEEDEDGEEGDNEKKQDDKKDDDGSDSDSVIQTVKSQQSEDIKQNGGNIENEKIDTNLDQLCSIESTANFLFSKKK